MLTLMGVMGKNKKILHSSSYKLIVSFWGMEGGVREDDEN